MNTIVATASTAPELIGNSASELSSSIFDTIGTVLPFAVPLIAALIGFRLMLKLVKPKG